MLILIIAGTGQLLSEKTPFHGVLNKSEYPRLRYSSCQELPLLPECYALPFVLILSIKFVHNGGI